MDGAERSVKAMGETAYGVDEGLPGKQNIGSILAWGSQCVVTREDARPPSLCRQD